MRYRMQNSGAAVNLEPHLKSMLLSDKKIRDEISTDTKKIFTGVIKSAKQKADVMRETIKRLDGGWTKKEVKKIVSEYRMSRIRCDYMKITME